MRFGTLFEKNHNSGLISKCGHIVHEFFSLGFSWHVFFSGILPCLIFFWFFPTAPPPPPPPHHFCNGRSLMGESWRLLLPLMISLFQTANQKNSNKFKNHMSPEPFVSRAKALPTKRSEKGYGDEIGPPQRRRDKPWKRGCFPDNLLG